MQMGYDRQKEKAGESAALRVRVRCVWSPSLGSLRLMIPPDEHPAAPRRSPGAAATTFPLGRSPEEKKRKKMLAVDSPRIRLRARANLCPDTASYDLALLDARLLLLPELQFLAGRGGVRCGSVGGGGGAFRGDESEDGGGQAEEKGEPRQDRRKTDCNTNHKGKA